jgi:hypothetical protein
MAPMSVPPAMIWPASGSPNMAYSITGTATTPIRNEGTRTAWRSSARIWVASSPAVDPVGFAPGLRRRSRVIAVAWVAWVVMLPAPCR